VVVDTWGIFRQRSASSNCKSDQYAYLTFYRARHIFCFCLWYCPGRAFGMGEDIWAWGRRSASAALVCCLARVVFLLLRKDRTKSCRWLRSCYAFCLLNGAHWRLRCLCPWVHSESFWCNCFFKVAFAKCRFIVNEDGKWVQLEFTSLLEPQWIYTETTNETSSTHESRPHMLRFFPYNPQGLA
jgi:hypothetical protein